MSWLRVLFLAFFSVLPLFSVAAVNSEDRYYTGIGIQLMWVTSDVRTFFRERNGQTETISNERGQLNGAILIAGVLRGGPAERAGVLDKDVILEIDGVSADTLLPAEIAAKIKEKSVGTPTRLSIGRLALDGRVVERRDIIVKTAKVDKVAWFPAGARYASGISHDSIALSVESKFTEDKKTGEFTYWYRLSNTSKSSVRIQWDVLDRVSRARYSSMVIVPLAPGESREFTLKSKHHPAEMRGDVRVLEEGGKSKASREKQAKEWGFTDHGGKMPILDTAVRFGAEGFVPEAFLKED